MKHYPEEVRGRKLCIISGHSEPAETFRKREHFIPEGLGFPWTALPKGTGTCDRINAASGEHEREWLRYGSMGVFRPWYVHKGKQGPPQFYAPKRSDFKLAFCTGDDGRFEMRVASEGSPLLPDEVIGPVDIEMNVPMTQANSTRVSLALHKMCLLSLWLAQPQLIFDPVFDDVRSFLNGPPDPATFRPFREDSRVPCEPGVSIHFMIKMSERPEEAHGTRKVALIDTVYGAVRAHHMHYLVSLAGDLVGLDDRAGVLREWQPLDETVRITKKIGFRANSVGPKKTIGKKP